MIERSRRRKAEPNNRMHKTYIHTENTHTQTRKRTASEGRIPQAVKSSREEEQGFEGRMQHCNWNDYDFFVYVNYGNYPFFMLIREIMNFFYVN